MMCVTTHNKIIAYIVNGAKNLQSSFNKTLFNN